MEQNSSPLDGDAYELLIVECYVPIIVMAIKRLPGNYQSQLDTLAFCSRERQQGH